MTTSWRIPLHIHGSKFLVFKIKTNHKWTRLKLIETNKTVVTTIMLLSCCCFAQGLIQFETSFSYTTCFRTPSKPNLSTDATHCGVHISDWKQAYQLMQDFSMLSNSRVRNISWKLKLSWLDWELNPGSSVYETDALPLGHRASYYWSPSFAELCEWMTWASITTLSIRDTSDLVVLTKSHVGYTFSSSISQYHMCESKEKRRKCTIRKLSVLKRWL